MVLSIRKYLLGEKNVRCYRSSSYKTGNDSIVYWSDLDNAVNSNLEPGIERFDFYQQEGDPSRFALIEIYRSDDAPEKHRETAHYKHWRDTVESMLVEPRTKITYKIIYQKSGEG